MLGIWNRLIGRQDEAEETTESLDEILKESLREEVVGETYTDDAIDVSLVTDARERILRNSHFFKDTWFNTNTMHLEQKEIVGHFLHELSQVVKNRGIILTSDVIDHLASMLERGETEFAHWQEPWMVPFKITRQRAVDLFEHCIAQTERSVPFERLQEFGMKGRWAKNYAELSDRLRADTMDGYSLMKVFRSALLRIARFDDRSDVRSICYTMDYALACTGDRQAMMRMSETLRRVSVPEGNDDDDSLVLTAARRNELSVVSDAWHRLAMVVRRKPMGDGEAELATMIATRKMDLRSLDSYFEDNPSWVLPSSNAVLIEAAETGEDWMATLFSPYPATVEPPRRPAGRTISSGEGPEIERMATILEMLLSPAVVASLKRSALEDAAKPLQEDELRVIATMMEKARKSTRITTSRLEQTIVGFAELLRQWTDIGVALSAAPVVEPVLDSVIDDDVIEVVPEEIIEDPFSDPPTMIVLDHIGESEESNKSSAQVTFGRLLRPFDLKAAARTPDEVFATLNAEFPWMRDANELAARAIAFSNRTASKALRLEPIVLNGPPGLGKTRWVRRLAEITGVPTHVSGLSGVDTTKSIIGSERGWASARPSIPAYAFMSTEAANPIIYVDEVDKASTKWEAISDAFLPMIESETAAKYPDIYLLGHLDLSAASFVFSANDLSRLSAEFRSRVRVVNIRVPNEFETSTVIRRMVEETCGKAMLDDDETGAISEELQARSREIFVKTTNLREVKQFIQTEVEKTIWSPPGLKIVK